MMALRINDIAPNFTAMTTHGEIDFHGWLGDQWGVLFSHPKDFTPVCTTELGYMAGLEEEFAKRNCKIIGLSVDPVSSHEAWADDIEDVQGHKVNYPMIGDHDLECRQVVQHAAGGRAGYFRRAYAHEQRHRAFSVRGRAGQDHQTDADLPDDHRP